MRISDWSSDVCSSDLLACPCGRHLNHAEALQHPHVPDVLALEVGVVHDGGDHVRGLEAVRPAGAPEALGPGPIRGLARLRVSAPAPLAHLANARAACWDIVCQFLSIQEFAASF